MDEVCKLINAGEPRRALVRLWHLAHQPHVGGGTRLDAWFQLARDDTSSARIRQYFANGQPSLTRTVLDARPTDVICALDELIARQTTKPPPLRPITIDGHDYFLIPGSPHGGVAQRQPVRFANYMRRNHIIPRQLEHHITAAVSHLATRSATARDQLAAIAERAPATLTIALGLFADGHGIDWAETDTGDGRRLCFARSTENEPKRLERAKTQILAAEAQDVDLLVFPELTLSLTVQAHLCCWLLDRYQAGAPCRIPLIVLGSFHDATCDNHRRNRSRLILGRDGSDIVLHDKFSPATLGTMTEQFTPGQTAQLVCTPIGNLSLAICKDCIDQYRNIWLRHLCPDWLLLPSLSDSVRLHVEATRELWNLHRCVSAVANQPLTAETLAAPPDPAAPHLGYVHADSGTLANDAFRNHSGVLWVKTVYISGNRNKPC